jgi:putative transposase
VVLDVFSRLVVGWSIDQAPSATLVTSALGMAIDARRPEPGSLIHSDHGTQSPRGLARMRVELLDRRRWRTRVELANAIFEFIEIFHNRKRRHSSLEMRTPMEFEKMHAYPSAVA